MNMRQADLGFNFQKAGELITLAAKDKPDVILLPETWNTGFFPKENLVQLSDVNGRTVKDRIGSLAARFGVNVVAGSVADCRDGKVFNSSYIFTPDGKAAARYDKTHLFSPMDENVFFAEGSGTVTFEINGTKCAAVICYDVRFPELIRKLALSGIKYLFVLSQWPEERVSQLHILLKARAVENQLFVACCNSCGRFDRTVFGGNSVIISPFGEVLAQAGAGEEIITADCDESIIAQLKSSMDVLRDRRPEIY